MESLSATSTAGVLLDLSGVLMLLLAFACLASKLFNRYVAYYGAQSVVLSFAAATAAVAFGILGLYGALLQTLNHALAKSVLFLSSGDVSLRYKTREAGDVSGLLTAVPVTGGVLLLASFAVLGSPPFGLFLSELTIVRAGFAHGSPVFPLLLLALLGLAFVPFARTTTGMVTGNRRRWPARTVTARRWR